MRVLITRPENRSGGTAAKLEELGHEAVGFPLFAAVQDRAALEAALAVPHAAIAITSAEAVRGLSELGDLLVPHLATPVFAVGRVTARAAEEAGFRHVALSIGGGPELAALVIEHYAASGRPDLPVLYLAAEKRMGRFEKLLAESDITCTISEIYRMEPVTYTVEEQQTMLVAQKADAVLLYSREAANAFFALDIFAEHREAIAKTLFLCLSRNIAEAVPEALANSAVVSMTPDEDALIDLL